MHAIRLVSVCVSPATEQLGDAAAAHDAYQKLVALSKSAASERPELAEARAYLARAKLDSVV